MLQCLDNHSDCCKTDWQNLQWHKAACWDKVARKLNQLYKTVSSVILLLTTQFFYDKQTYKNRKITLFICTHTHTKKNLHPLWPQWRVQINWLVYISTITKLHKKANQFRFVDSVCVCVHLEWVVFCFVCVCVCVLWVSRYNLNGAQKVWSGVHTDLFSDISTFNMKFKNLHSIGLLLSTAFFRMFLCATV